MITLQPFNLKNVGLHFKWNNDKHINYFDSDYPYQIEDFTTFSSRVNRIAENTGGSNYIYEIHVSDTQQMIGVVDIIGVDHCNLQCSVSCTIGDKKFRNKGYGTAALKQTVNLCFKQLGMNKVTTAAFDFHSVWVHIVKKCGFTIEGVLRQHELKGEKFSDKMIFALLRQEFEVIEFNKVHHKAV